MELYEDWGFATLPAPEQMALDASMLAYAADTGQACARFYDFPEDAVVFGYSQEPHGRPAVAHRVTGGSHIQVGPGTMAYSIAVPHDRFAGVGDLRSFYAGVVADGLRDLGVEDVCVDHDASTICAGGRIIASHAIRWQADSALFHGLLLVEPYDVDAVGEQLPLRERTIQGERYTEYDALQNLASLTTALDREDGVKQAAGEAVWNALLDGGERRQRDPGWIRDRVPALDPEQVEAAPVEGEPEGAYCLFTQVPDHDFQRMARPP